MKFLAFIREGPLLNTKGWGFLKNYKISGGKSKIQKWGIRNGFIDHKLSHKSLFVHPHFCPCACHIHKYLLTINCEI